MITQNWFPNWLHYFTFPPALCNGSSFCTSLSIVIIITTTTITLGMKWCLIVALICISLKNNNVEHLFMCLLAIYLSLERYLFKFCQTHFLIRLLFYSLTRSSLFWIQVPYQIGSSNIFSHSCALIFHFPLSVPWSTKVFNFDAEDTCFYILVLKNK